MRLSSRQRSDPETGDANREVSGTLRVDRRSGALTPRLRTGDIAVLDHLDLDRGTAQGLIDAGVVAVVNAAPFISGRYPNLGPELLARAHVLMLDDVGDQVFSRLRDGSFGRIADGGLWVDDAQVASGRVLHAEAVASRMEQARGGLAAQLSSVGHNTTDLLQREQELFLHGRGLPATATSMRNRPVVVVVRDHDYRQDLRRLRRFVREQRPILIGVDGGADALVRAGHRPDVVVVGEPALRRPDAPDRGGAASARDVVSDRTLRGAREIVVHDTAPRSGPADRLERLGLGYQTVTAAATGEDVALLLADAGGASLIVSVGSHVSLDQFLDRERGGLAGTVLTRTRLAPRLVDAKSVPLLYSGRVRLWQLLLVLLAGLLALGVALAATPVGAQWWSTVQDAVSDALTWVQGHLP